MVEPSSGTRQDIALGAYMSRVVAVSCTSVPVMFCSIRVCAKQLFISVARAEASCR